MMDETERDVGTGFGGRSGNARTPLRRLAGIRGTSMQKSRSVVPPAEAELSAMLPAGKVIRTRAPALSLARVP